MADELDRLHGKVDKLDERLDSIDKTLVINTTLLGEHIKRTNLLEAKVVSVEDHVKFVKRFGKFIAWSIGVLSGLSAIVAALHLL